MLFWRLPTLTTPLPGPDPSAARRESVERAEGAPSRSAEGAPSMAMSADRRECAAVHKIRVSARTEISTARREHGIYGDERGRLTNNKSKGSKAQLEGGWQSRAAG